MLLTPIHGSLSVRCPCGRTITAWIGADSDQEVDGSVFVRGAFAIRCTCGSTSSHDWNATIKVGDRTEAVKERLRGVLGHGLDRLGHEAVESMLQDVLVRSVMAS